MSVRVLYLMGWGRSGSTLLGNIIGQSEDVFSAGEIWLLWRRLVLRDRACGCGAGAVVGDCDTWRAILERAFGGEPDARRLMEIGDDVLRYRRIPELYAARGGRGPLAGPVAAYREALARLYPAIADVTGRRVIVDVSKLPIYASLLASVPGIEVDVVHLVRDSRACLLANLRGEPSVAPGLGLALWCIANLAAERWAGTSRYRRLRYEDFVARPAELARRMLRSAGVSAEGLRFETATRIDLRPTHTVGGNPRFAPGPVEIALGDEWRRLLPPRARAAATALTWPLLLRYGYPLRVGAPAESA